MLVRLRGLDRRTVTTKMKIKVSEATTIAELEIAHRKRLDKIETKRAKALKTYHIKFMKYMEEYEAMRDRLWGPKT